VVGVDTRVHSLRPGSALTFKAGAATIIRLMTSAAAMSIYIARTGHPLILVIQFLLVIGIQFNPTLARIRLIQARVIGNIFIQFYSVNLILSLPHFRLPFLRLLHRCASRNDERQWFFRPGQASLLFPSANL
jgi:hypothetical protein